MQEDFGIMTEAYHISRTDLMIWMNKLLSTKLYRIEQLGTGAVHCQLLDYFFPGSLNFAKVNWRSQNSWEFVANFKILQQGFDNLSLKKKIDVEKLTQAKYQDNLEFAQWIKRFCDINGVVPEDEYDAVSKRNNQNLFYLRNIKKYQNMMAMVERRESKQGNGSGVQRVRSGPMIKTFTTVLSNRGGKYKNNGGSTSKKNISSKKLIPNRKAVSSVGGGVRRRGPSQLEIKLRNDFDFVMTALKSTNGDKEIVHLLKQKFNIPISEKDSISDSLPSEEEEEEDEDDDDEYIKNETKSQENNGNSENRGKNMELEQED